MASRQKEKKPNQKINISTLKDKKFDALFLSDIHFLVSNEVIPNAHLELLELLQTMSDKKIEFTDIFLVGDIVENWYFSAEAIRARDPKKLNILFDLFEKLRSQEGSLYYIVGNHDTLSFNQGVSSWLRDYLEERGWILCEWYQNAHFIAIHGHQGQYTRISWMFNILGVRILYGLGRLIPGLFSLAEKWYNGKLNHKKVPTEKQITRYYEKVAKMVHQRNRVMVTGHTHEFLMLKDRKILNTGDWLGSRSLIVRKSRTFTGYRLIDRELRQDYVFREELLRR